MIRKSHQWLSEVQPTVEILTELFAHCFFIGLHYFPYESNVSEDSENHITAKKEALNLLEALKIL